MQIRGMGVDNILEATALCKTFVIGKNNEQETLKNIHLQIKQGEFVTIMGPSGSGKSTLLYNISGMERMTSGRVRFKGHELSELTEEELARLRLQQMGFIFQQHHLLKNLSIFDNIILSAYLNKKKNRQQINDYALKLMKKTGIEKLAKHNITQASGGQLQRVAICRALINQPQMIFGDEPTGALNSKTAQEIMALLADINNIGTTILLVTHDANVALKTERVLYMFDGSITGELHLGKYNTKEQSIKRREEKLASWLMSMEST